MPIGITRPTVNPVPGDTIVGQKCIVAILETGESTAKNFRATVAGINKNVGTLDRNVPDDNGTLQPDRTVVISAVREIQLTVDEFSQDFLDTFINGNFVEGTARLWIGDPSDVAGVSRLMSNEFNCLAYQSGAMNSQADQFTTAQVTLKVNGTFTLSKDADSAS
jgi:hypothetical protein